jgi:hypothetical protein
MYSALLMRQLLWHFCEERVLNKYCQAMSVLEVGLHYTENIILNQEEQVKLASYKELQRKYIHVNYEYVLNKQILSL